MAIDSNSLKRYINTLPKVFNAESNRVIYAFLYAIAISDDDVEAGIDTAHKDLFVRTATGQNLNKLANSLGVDRPATLGLTDQEYQNLIPNLSLKPKTIRKAFYDTADVFWGPLFSRANIKSLNFGPFNVFIGDDFSFRIDNGDIQTVKVLTGDLASPGFATAAELVTILNKIHGITAIVQVDSLTGNEYINIRTNTPGSTGKLEIVGGTGINGSKLDLTVGVFTILNLAQRVAIYNINSNEILIEIPAIVPALRRTLRGSHHFHADSTIEPPVPPKNGVWKGSFLFNPTGSVGTNTITGQKCTLQSPITKGQVYTSILVDDNSLFKNPSGQVLFDFGISDLTTGKELQEGPVKYRGIPNSSTILLDPSYTFKHDHDIGTEINVISKNEPYVPLKTGKDYAIYLTSPSGAREIVENILQTLKAAGVTLTFVVLAPKYKYIIDNPYLPEQEPEVP